MSEPEFEDQLRRYLLNLVTPADRKEPQPWWPEGGSRVWGLPVVHAAHYPETARFRRIVPVGIIGIVLAAIGAAVVFGCGYL